MLLNQNSLTFNPNVIPVLFQIAQAHGRTMPKKEKDRFGFLTTNMINGDNRKSLFDTDHHQWVIFLRRDASEDGTRRRCERYLNKIHPSRRVLRKIPITKISFLAVELTFYIITGIAN